MIPITLPPELELPEGQTELSAVVEIIEGQAFLVALDGMPLGEEEMEEEEPEDEMEDQDFLAAVEQGLAGPQP